MFTKDRVPRIGDFGYAHLSKDNKEPIMGTPAYMAPEQWDRLNNQSSDIWACGVLLYEMLTGRMPFEDDNQVRL